MSIRIIALCSALLLAAAPAGAQQFNDWMTPRPGYTVGSGVEIRTGQAIRAAVAYDNGYREGVEARREGRARSQGARSRA